MKKVLDRKQVAINIKILLLKNCMNQRKLAQILGLKSPSSASDKIKGKTDFTMDEIIILINHFNTTFEEIFLTK